MADAASARSDLGAGPAGDGVYMQLDAILSDEAADGPGASLASLAQVEALARDLGQVCDVKRVHGLELYRLDVARATAWLCDRVTRTAAALAERPSLDAAQARDLRATAAELVGEYLNDAWAARLTAAIAGTPADAVSVAAPVASAAAAAASGPLEDYSRPTSGAKGGDASKKARPTPAQKALSAVDTSSMRKLSAFFGKKP
jgi:hypothetical protein